MAVSVFFYFGNASDDETLLVAGMKWHLLEIFILSVSVAPADANACVCSQVVSMVLINLIPQDKPLLSLVGKSSIAEKVRFVIFSCYFGFANLFSFLLM